MVRGEEIEPPLAAGKERFEPRAADAKRGGLFEHNLRTTGSNPSGMFRRGTSFQKSDI